jgi:hypothetical protein
VGKCGAYQTFWAAEIEEAYNRRKVYNLKMLEKAQVYEEVICRLFDDCPN